MFSPYNEFTPISKTEPFGFVVTLYAAGTVVPSGDCNSIPTSLGDV